jgi:hypothetical protein
MATFFNFASTLSILESNRKAYHILEKNFPKVLLKDMDILQTKENWTKVLQLVPDEGLIFSVRFYGTNY